MGAATAAGEPCAAEFNRRGGTWRKQQYTISAQSALPTTVPSAAAAGGVGKRSAAHNGTTERGAHVRRGEHGGRAAQGGEQQSRRNEADAQERRQ